jgi:hypothetical protein
MLLSVFLRIVCLATSCKNAVICSMSLGDIFAEPNMLAGFVSTERSMSIAFSNVATWNASDEATTGSDVGGRSVRTAVEDGFHLGLFSLGFRLLSLLCRLPFDPIGFACSLSSVEALGLGERETTSGLGFGLGLLVGLDPLQDCRLGTSLRDLPHIGFADMPLPGGSGSQDLFDDFGAELAGGQHEDRLKAEVIEIGLEKRSACVFEVHGVGPSGGLHIILR